jgi:hypothetical protein
MIKSTPIKAASTGGMKTRLAVGVIAGSSSFHKYGTSVDVLVGGAFSTTGASRTPRANDANNEDDDGEEPPLNSADVTTTLEG